MKPHRQTRCRLRKALQRRSRRNHPGFTLTEILAVMAILSIIIVSLFTIFQQGTETWRLSTARTESYVKARQVLEMMAREVKGAVMITAARGPSAEDARGYTARADFVGVDVTNLTQVDDWRNDYQKYSDQIYFVAPATNSGKQELCMIGYWIKDIEDDTKSPLGQNGVPRDAKDDVLQRSYRTDNNGDPDEVWRMFNFADFGSAAWEATQGFVASGVRQLDITYYDYEDRGVGARQLKEYEAWDSLPSNKGGSTSTKDDDNKLPVAVRITITVGDENDVIKPIKLSRIVFLDNAGQR